MKIKFKRIEIKKIKVGERIREELGDIAGLAESIDKFQLIHPIVVDSELNLIAGYRRYLACKKLGWKKIACRMYDELNTQERFAIEQEENLVRKDFTPYEASRKLVEDAKRVAPLLVNSLNSTAELKRKPRKKRYGVGKKDVAQALGVSVGKLVNAEHHVEAVDANPELKDSTQREALQTLKPEVEEDTLRIFERMEVKLKDLGTADRCARYFTDLNKKRARLTEAQKRLPAQQKKR